MVTDRPTQLRGLGTLPLYFSLSSTPLCVSSRLWNRRPPRSRGREKDEEGTPALTAYAWQGHPESPFGGYYPRESWGPVPAARVSGR